MIVLTEASLGASRWVGGGGGVAGRVARCWAFA